MKLTKKIVLLSSGVLLSFVILDVLSAYVLFYYQKGFVVKNIWGPTHASSIIYAEGSTPTFSIIKTVIERIDAKARFLKEGGLQPQQGRITPYKVLFMRDAELGWSAAPGSYEFFFNRPEGKYEEWPRFYSWHVTILPDGSRATSRHPATCDRNIRIFGDSWLFGWALGEELTMAWHLQSEYKKMFCVSLLAHGGYGHLQALRNFRKWQPKTGDNDILILGYAQWLLPRNLPSPSVVRSLSEGLKHYADDPDKPLMYPRATNDGSRLMIDTIPLDCKRVRDYCEKAEPTLDELFDVTNKIFDEIINNTHARIFVLLLDGPEDKVIQHLKARGVTVVDGRPPEGIFAKDTMNPYDAHPGPIANLYWFTQLRQQIDKLI
jgi:hypothetical protein